MKSVVMGNICLTSYQHLFDLGMRTLSQTKTLTMLGLRRCFLRSPLERRLCLSTETSLESVAPTLRVVERHGKGDGCITLNVGGTEFYTLRSTVQSNDVLALHVARAEANKEIMKDGAVFIDRDPKHFGLVLAYLRNRIENLDATKLDAKTAYVSMTKSMSCLQLPSDSQSISELFVEASFYDIGPLKKRLLSHNVLANFFNIFNQNSGNPFDTAAKLVTRLRTGFLVVGATGGTLWITLQEDFEWAAKQAGLKSTKDMDRSPEETITSDPA